MYDSETGEEVASTEFVGVYFDMEQRVATVLPGTVRQRAVQLRSAHVRLAPDIGGDTEEMVAAG